MGNLTGCRSALLRLGILVSFLLAFAIASDPSPIVQRKEFKNQPYELSYFGDSKTILLCDEVAGQVHVSNDEGSEWNLANGIDEPVVRKIYIHPNNNQVAVALSARTRHWITKDQGQTWTGFESELPPALTLQPLSFHATDADRIILNMRDWRSGPSVSVAAYTTDGFKTSQELRDGAIRCMWARENELFSTGDASTDRDRTICLVMGRYSTKQSAWRLVRSDDFFDQVEDDCVVSEGGQPITGIASSVAVKGYILAAQNSDGTDEMALWVTQDSTVWYRAQFGQHQVKENGYTIMESTNHSLQVDVASVSHSSSAMGNLFTSNSAGQYFTRSDNFTNRNPMGFVDYEHIANVQGIALTNVVANWKEVLEIGREKRINTKITFDDGREYHEITSGGQSLHLHSVSDQRNAGRVFSSVGAPGLVMGLGNTGDYLRDYSESDLFVSDNAGYTWSKALDGPHKYEFGDQGSVLLAIYDKVEIAKMIYSLDHGKHWQQFFLKDYDFPEPVRAQMLTTIPDSTSLKFLLLATTGTGTSLRHWVYTIDFAGLKQRKCDKDDFEVWYARVDKEDKPTCVMGHKQSFRRRKATADCVVDEEFKDPVPIFDNSGCLCTENDFECDFGFTRSADRSECLPIYPVDSPEGQCKTSEGTFKGPSGFRKIPGNECILEGGVDKSKDIERPCKDSFKAPSSGAVARELTYFPTDQIKEYYYLERSGSSSGADETVVLLTNDRVVYVSHDQGKTWATPRELEDVEVLAIYPNRFLNDAIYFLTAGTQVFYSKDRAQHIHSFKAPGRPNTAHVQILRFHPKNADWLIWTTCAEGGLTCQPFAYVTTHNGDSWSPLLRSVENCEFVWREERKVSEQLVFCTQYANEDATGAKQLVASDDWFDHKVVHFKDMLNFATMSEFIVVAAKDAEDSQFLRVDASIDGNTFADARFPSNFHVPHQTAYTVLDSSTHSIFLHVTVNSVMEQEYGSIIKSNSNGTSYIMSLNGVNRNGLGYVDFEKMLGLEGVAVVNVVSNIDAVQDGNSKILKTMITHNDGAEWSLIGPPTTDAAGKANPCGGKTIDECSLHLHGYTERKDPRDTYSSPSAVGLMMGVGNIGASLGRKREGDTYVSSDGGISWRPAKQGVYMWEFGDHGSLLVMVEEYSPTRYVYYSRDEGRTWTEYQFADADHAIDDITTVPSDTSRNFILWGRELTGQGRAVTISLDFSGLTDRQCNLDTPGTSSSDFDLWEPSHPANEAKGLGNCLFGHVAQYSRKKTDADCYVGPQEFSKLYSISRNCTCTRSDYECDYNFERTAAGDCQLVPGLKPKDPEEICRANPEIDTWFEVSGYRKLPLSTCEGGTELDKAVESHACPGHEDEYRKKNGISGAALFFAIVLPIAAAAIVGWFAWKQLESRFGRIRLGDETPRVGGIGGGASSRLSSMLDGDSLFVRIPVVIVSAAAAGIMAVPTVIGALVKAVRGRGSGGAGGSGRYGGSGGYTSRGSFARARGRQQDYNAVQSGDEDDLLGDDFSEDDV